MVGSRAGEDTVVPHKHSFVEKWEVQATGILVGSCQVGTASARQ